MFKVIKVIRCIRIAVFLLVMQSPLVMSAGSAAPPVITLGGQSLSRAEFKEQFEIAMVFKAIQTGVPVKNQDQIYVMEHRFLDQRAQDMVLYQMAWAQGITLSEQELEQYLNEFMQGLGFSGYSKKLITQLGFESDIPFREYMHEKKLVLIFIESMKNEPQADENIDSIEQRIDEIMRQADIRIYPDVVDALPER